MYFEGAGDALFCGDTLFAGYRIRSDIGGHQQLGDLLGCRVIPLELVDPRFYHLDTCFCPLAARRGDLLSAGLRRLRPRVLARVVGELIAVARPRPAASPATRWWWAGRVITNTGCPELHRELDRAASRPGDAAGRVRQGRRIGQVPHAAAGRRRRRRLEIRGEGWLDRRRMKVAADLGLQW